MADSTRTRLRHVATIGRTELRRRWRTIRGNTGQLVAIAITALFFVPMGLAGLGGAYLFGRAVAAGDVETPVRWFRLGFVAAWVVVAAFGGYRAYATLTRPKHVDGLLTTVSHRELLGGLLFVEAVNWGVPVGGYALLATAAFAAATGAPAVLLFLPLTVVCTLATGLAVGVAVALVVRNLGVRSRLLARIRTLLIVLLAIAYFGAIVTQSLGTILGPLRVILEPTPVGWLGDLALLGTGGGASIARAAGAFAASVALLLASAVVLPRLAELLWYADGVHLEHEVEPARPSGTTTSSGAASPLARVLPRSMLAVLRVDWKRARRAPVSKSFVVYAPLVLMGPITTTFETGAVGTTLPLLTAVVGAWMTGSLFALNPLGNEGAVLPATLLAEDPGRALVGGHVVAGALVGVPLTVVATVALGLVSPLSATATVTLAVAGLVLAAAAGPLASGIGALFPRFEAVSVSRSTRAIVPSLFGFAVYSIVLFVLAAPALLGHSAIVGDVLTDAIGTSQLLVATAGTVVSALLVTVFGAASAYYAVGKIERYAVD